MAEPIFEGNTHRSGSPVNSVRNLKHKINGEQAAWREHLARLAAEAMRGKVRSWTG